MAIKHIKINKKNLDKRGFLIPLVDEDHFKVKNVLYIFSKAGSIRGNHYHKKESYWDFCLEGKFKYYEKDIKKPKSKLESVVVNAGEMIYCPAKIAHAIETLEDSTIICIASRSRKKETYDADVVKVNII
ncbi:MAG: WxcM-like domain-containing protein [Candidatus Daviesbacteria bacterium]|nr:WxcM-like domain-containing protein [Candidatus Daviesbacteria bacterium]